MFATNDHLANPLLRRDQKRISALFVFLEATAVRDSSRVAGLKASELHDDALLQVPLNGLEDGIEIEAGPPLLDLEEEGAGRKVRTQFH